MDLTHLPLKKKMAIMSGALMGLLLAALDQTIVGTALPKIVADLGGIDQYTWVVTIYLLTSTVFVPIFGKLSDVYGRKPMLAAGMIIFVTGSILAGLSQNMLELIIFRGIQGMGAASLMANTFTIVADLFVPAERGKWMGLVGATFGLSSVIGPLLGGYITDYMSWRWNFYVNVPVGILAFTILLMTMPWIRNKVEHTIDYLGSLLLAAALSTLLLALTWGGSEYEWGSWQVLSLLGGAALAIAGFLFAESRAKDPIVPLDLFKDRIVSNSLIITFLSGVGMFAAIVYIPLFAQVVQGKSATNSGVIILPLVLAMVIGAIGTGQLISRIGRYKIFAIVGGLIMTGGLVLLSTIKVSTGDGAFVAMMMVTGIGLGLMMPTFNLAVQNTVAHHRVGVATSLLQLFRGLGATLGLAVLGSMFNSRLPGNIADATDKSVASQLPAPMVEKLSDPQVLASPEAAEKIFSQVPKSLLSAIDQILEAVKTGLAETIALAFLVAAIFSAAAFLLTFFLREIPLRTENAGHGAAGGNGGSKPGDASSKSFVTVSAAAGETPNAVEEKT